MKRITLFGGLAALALAAILVGCDPNKDKSTETGQTAGTTTPGKSTEGAGSTGGAADTGKPATIAGAPTYEVITNGISPFWDAMSKGLYQADKDLKVNGDWQAPNPANHVEQVKIFRDAMAAKRDGIAVSAIEADALVGTINEAMDQGIPVITFDSDSAKSKRLAYLGTNNFEAGRTAGQEAVKLFPNGGKLVAFVGNMGAQNARDRYDGFKAAIAGHNITFLQEPFEDNKDKGMARKNVEDAITRYQSQGLNGLVGLYSYNGPAIVGAVQAQGLRDKMKIICFDGEPETLKNLSQGLVDVTVVQKPYEFGRLSIMLLNYLHNDNKDIDKALQDLKPELDKLNMKLDMKTHNIDTGVDVITPANAQPFIQKLKEKGLEST